MKKIAVLTSSIGINKDLTKPKFLNKADYHAFLVKDEGVDVKGWNVHKAIEFSSDPKYKNRRNAKIYKIIPHLVLPGYDYYFWMDATHSLEMDPEEVVEKYLSDSDIAVFKHPERNCIYEESKFIKKIGFDYINLIEDQMSFYRDMKYPSENGLYELSSRIQKNTELTQTMGLMWWEQICMFSSRDQLSFPFVCNQLGIAPNILPGKATTINGNRIMPQVIDSFHRRSNF